MVMIFQLVSTAQEWLNMRWDEIKIQKEEEKARRQKELEEVERVTNFISASSIIRMFHLFN